jgi:hypothetical protein
VLQHAGRRLELVLPAPASALPMIRAGADVYVARGLVSNR